MEVDFTIAFGWWLVPFAWTLGLIAFGKFIEHRNPTTGFGVDIAGLFLWLAILVAILIVWLVYFIALAIFS